ATSPYIPDPPSGGHVLCLAGGVLLCFAIFRCRIMDDRRKRLLYRATHRGTKESDVIIGGFFAVRTDGLSDAQVAEAEVLLEENDIDLVNWILGRDPVPDRWRDGLFAEIAAHFREPKA